MHNYRYFTKNNESPQGKFQIYISYSHVDGGSYALEIAQKLTDEFDCAVVMDESPSERPIYENNENKELLSSNLVVFVATQKAIMSESIRVNDISTARHMNIPIIAVCSENVHTDRLCSLIGSPYYIQMNSNRYEEIFRKIFSALIIPPKEIEMLRGFVLNMPKDHNQTECYAAGRAYYLGRNIEEACKWFAKAAQGDSLKIKCMAGHMLGMINYIGLGIRQDFSEAYSWFTQSASFAASSFMLGYMYEVGEGKAVNYPSAVRCYTNAAENWGIEMLSIFWASFIIKVQALKKIKV